MNSITFFSDPSDLSLCNVNFITFFNNSSQHLLSERNHSIIQKSVCVAGFPICQSEGELLQLLKSSV